MRVEDVAAPGMPQPRWVRVKVSMAGICGSDLHNFKTGQWITRSPSIAGHEFTGIIKELGVDVEGVAIGDPVVADSRFWCGVCQSCQNGQQQLCSTLGFIGEARDGCFAEEINLPAKLLHRIPPTLSPRIAAMAEPFAVALHAVRRLRLIGDEPVLIVGCGPIGGLAAVVLAHLGHSRVIVADLDRNRADLVAHVTGATSSGLEQIEIQTILKGRTLKAAIDATGSIKAFGAIIDCVSAGACIAVVGISNGTIDFDPNILVERELTLVGCHAFQNEMPEAIAIMSACAEMLEQLIDREVTLAEVPDAYARIAAGQVNGLKTLIRV